MRLPINYYDVALKHRPNLVASAELDGEDLRRQGRTNPVAVIDELTAPRLGDALQIQGEQLLQELAKLRHCTIDQVKYSLATSEHDKRNLNAYITTIEFDYHCFLNFSLAGKKVFYFQDGLVQQLANSEMNVPASMLQLPYPTSMFVFTAPDILEAMYEVNTGNGQRDAIVYDTPLTVFLSIIEPDKEQNYRRLVMLACHADDKKMYHVVKRSLALFDEWDLEQALHTDWDDILKDNGNRGFHMTKSEDYRVGKSTDETFYTDGLHFFRVLINSILYVSSINAETLQVASPHTSLDQQLKEAKSSLERRDLFRAAQKASKLPYVLVGASVHSVDCSEAPPDQVWTKRKLSVRFSVKGHFRQQPYGPGRQERRLQYIHPFYKGPEMADLINKPYIVR